VSGAAWPPGARAVLHVDMDAFFVAVELLDRPELVGRPVVVGGTGSRGVVAAASYEARAYGVHSALASAVARRRCPQAVFLAGRHERYREVSARVMALFAEVTPLVEPLSLDEAFLDVSGARRLLGDPVAIAHSLRERVYDAEGLSCCVGVATVKFVAKLASAAAKPRADRTGVHPGAGVLPVPPGTELSFLHLLPIGRLWGVGPATLERLARLGVRTVGDLAALPLGVVVGALGEAGGRHLHALANGIDPRPVVPHEPARSIGHEQTFPSDIADPIDLAAELARLSDAVVSRLRTAGLTGRTVTVKVRFGDFRTVTRSITLERGTDARSVVLEAARSALGRLDLAAGVRLLGVSVSNLGGDEPEQLSLDDLLPGPGATTGGADEAVDRIRARFGNEAIGLASTLRRGPLAAPGGGAHPWGPDRPVDGHPERP
jgi:DNA polymerase IV